MPNPTPIISTTKTSNNLLTQLSEQSKKFYNSLNKSTDQLTDKHLYNNALIEAQTYLGLINRCQLPSKEINHAIQKLKVFLNIFLLKAVHHHIPHNLTTSPSVIDSRINKPQLSEDIIIELFQAAKNVINYYNNCTNNDSAQKGKLSKIIAIYRLAFTTQFFWLYQVAFLSYSREDDLSIKCARKKTLIHAKKTLLDSRPLCITIKPKIKKNNDIILNKFKQQLEAYHKLEFDCINTTTRLKLPPLKRGNQSKRTALYKTVFFQAANTSQKNNNSSQCSQHQEDNHQSTIKTEKTDIDFSRHTKKYQPLPRKLNLTPVP